MSTAGGDEREDEPPRTDEPASTGGPRPEHVRALRLGHGANCSSVGSVIDTLFLSAAVGGALFAAVCAAMRDEPVRVVGDATPPDPRDGDARPGDDEVAP